MPRIVCLLIVCGVLCVSINAGAGQIANVKYIHDYINQKHSVNINIANPLQTQAANMKYLLCMVDLVNQELNGAPPTVRYCDHALALQQAVDTTAVVGAIDSLVSLSGSGDPYLHLALADYPGVYTYSSEFNALHPTYLSQTVTIDPVKEEDLEFAGIYPGYYVQSICTNEFGSYGEPGLSESFGQGTFCWCRAKRKANAQNSDWIYSYNLNAPDSTACAKNCGTVCVNAVTTNQDFMIAVFEPWINP